MPLSVSSLLDARRPSRDRLAPPHLGRLHIVRDDVFDGPGFPRLGNRQWTSMGGQEGRGDAGQDQAREHRDGQDVLLDLLSPLRLGRAKDDALHAVVDAAARLEGDGTRGAGEVAQVRLEQPEGLRAVSRHVGLAEDTVARERAHQKGAVDRLLAQVDDEFLQGHGVIVDADEQVA